MARNERGYLLIGVMLLTFIALVLTAGMLQMSATNTKTRALVKTQAEYYYEAEETLNRAVAWLQANSKNLVGAFVAANFANNFDLRTAPATGANEGEFFKVPSMVAIKGGANSPMLSNNEFFGEAAFPATKNIDTGAAFDAVSAFRSADLGKANARAVVIWARATNGDYAPIFRVDAVTGNNPDRGAHTFTYVYSKLETSSPTGGKDGIGFFTQTLPLTTKTGNNRCDSYAWTYTSGSGWSKGAPRANCIVASNSTISLEGRISGDALSNVSNGVSVNRPKGEVSGTICGSSGCHSHSISALSTWSDTCSTASQGNKTITGIVQLGSGSQLSQQCWDTITIEPNATLVLTDTDNVYRFRQLLFQNNSNSKLQFPLIEPGKHVELFVDNLANGTINGNQFVNTNNAPKTVKINITSDQEFKMNGTADINAHIFAPLSKVEHLGTFNYHGAIEASGFAVTGNGTFNYDEGINEPLAPTVSDMKLSLKKASQRYR